jgi:hypothetical protein
MLADEYAAEHAKFPIGTKFKGTDGRELIIEKIYGHLLFNGGVAEVKISYGCRDNLGWFGSLNEWLIESFKRHD